MTDSSNGVEPTIIQGGMGVGISDWQLARAVSLTGQLGVVSGTAIDVVMTRRLQLGDPGGHMRRALSEFPFPDMVKPILQHYFVPGGKSPEAAYRNTPVTSQAPGRQQQELVIVANFVEVFLAKEGHHGRVGIVFAGRLSSEYGKDKVTQLISRLMSYPESRNSCARYLSNSGCVGRLCGPISSNGLVKPWPRNRAQVLLAIAVGKYFE